MSILTETICWRHFTKRADCLRQQLFWLKSFDDVTSPKPQPCNDSDGNYPDGILSWVYLISPDKCCDSSSEHDCFLPHPLHPYRLAAYRREILTASFTCTANQIRICQSKSVIVRNGNSELCDSRSFKILSLFCPQVGSYSCMVRIRTGRTGGDIERRLCNDWYCVLILCCKGSYITSSKGL